MAKPKKNPEAVQWAETAANEAHDRILGDEWTATFKVYPEVVEAAERAYRWGGGRRKLVCRGCGNATHPVIAIRCYEE